MTRTLALAVGLMFLGFAGRQTTAAQSDFKTILDGTSLKGWDIVGDADWTVADGAVQATTGTGFLVTPMLYTDFQITADFWVTDDANSGVFIRCEDPKTMAAKRLRSEHFRQTARPELSDGRHCRCRQADGGGHDRRQMEHHRHHRSRSENDRAHQRPEDG